jgi:hypothetical protein
MAFGIREPQERDESSDIVRFFKASPLEKRGFHRPPDGSSRIGLHPNLVTQ